MNNLQDDFLEQQRARNQINQRHEHLYSDFRAGKINEVTAQWHQHIDEIDISLQRDPLHGNLVASGLTVLNGVDVEKLFDNMTEADAEMFRRKILYESAYDHTTSNVINFWLNNEKLTPPTIIIFDQQYMDDICPSGIPSNEFKPVDGKHRLNVACYFGAKTIPILVLKRQLELITAKVRV